MASCPCLSPPRPLQAKPFFFAARKISSGRGRSLPPRTLQAERFFSAATKIRIGRRTAPPQRTQQAKQFSPASILKFGPEIKNRCTQQGINRQNLASILKFGPEIMNRCTKQSIFSTHPQHASSAHPPARVQARVLPWVFCMGTGSTVVRQRFDSGGKSGC